MVATSHSTTPKDHLKQNYIVLKTKIVVWVKRKVQLYVHFYFLFEILKCYCDQNYTFPFTFSIGKKRGEYNPCQILNGNSNGELDCF